MKRAPGFKAAFKIPGSILRCRWSRAFESWCIGPFLTRPSPCQSQRKWAILYHRFRVVQHGRAKELLKNDGLCIMLICSNASPFLALVQVGPANHGHLNRLTAALGHDALKRGEQRTDLWIPYLISQVSTGVSKDTSYCPSFVLTREWVEHLQTSEGGITLAGMPNINS